MEASGTRPKLPFSKDPQGSSALSRSNSATRTFNYGNFLTDSVLHTPARNHSSSHNNKGDIRIKNVTFKESNLIDDFVVSVDNDNPHGNENKFDMTKQENATYPIVKSKSDSS